MKDQQINELSEMVKELLKEQQYLKDQIITNKQQPKKAGGPQSHGLNKKASERVPRKNIVNIGGSSSSLSRATEEIDGGK